MRRGFLALGLTLALAACGGATPNAVEGVGGETAATSSGGAGIVVADGAGWSGNQLFGTIPPADSCHVGHENGQVLPDRHCTPGAIDPRVTQATLKSTICRPGGYTSSVRPPSSVTDKAKRELLKSYGLTGAMSEYELDHLIPLAVGGASDVRNLWPEQDIGKPSEYDRGAEGLNAKDGVELRLHDAVCKGETPLAAAQEAIATDWLTALSRLGLSR